MTAHHPSNDIAPVPDSGLRGIVACLADPESYSSAVARAEACLGRPGFERELRNFVAESTRILVARDLMTTHLSSVPELRAHIDLVIETDTWTALEARSLPIDGATRKSMPLLAEYLGAVEEILAEARRQSHQRIGIEHALPSVYRDLVGGARERIVGSARDKLAGVVSRVVGVVGG